MWFGTRGLKPLRLNTCNPLTVIARLANTGTGAALLPREILSLSGGGLDLRGLEADPPVTGHHLCAMRRAAEPTGEYAYLADMAGPIAHRQADHSAKSKSGLVERI